eukprot:scaffold15216_cov79-Isochrysis_galbana.AAC.1
MCYMYRERCQRDPNPNPNPMCCPRTSMLSRWECSSGSAAATTVPNAAVSILSPAMVCVW